jgi:primosomal protein N' (replication factor Y)
LSDVPQFESPKDIFGLIEKGPLLTPSQIALAFWISDYYFSSLFSSCALMLPPGFERSLLTFVQCPRGVSPEDLSALTPEEKELVGLVAERGKMALKELERQLGKRKAQSRVQALVRKGILSRTFALEREKVRPKRVKFIALNVTSEEAQRFIQSWQQDKRYESRIAVVELLLKTGKPLTLLEVKDKSGRKQLPLNTLIKSGVISLEERRIRRDPLSMCSLVTASAPLLTPLQERVWHRLEKAMEGANQGTGACESGSRTFLLHGVTGSGKTEIYLRAVAKTIAMGRRAIVLVPEIALTPQTISRFLSRFPGKVAVLHSGLSLGEQYDEWWRIKRGECDVVIGSRSAIFSPQPDLGLIVIDEEHEWTYKQKETHPLYHARDVALKLAELTGAVVILGSATPDVCDYYLAQEGYYQLLELPKRISSQGESTLPQVEIVDMRKELSEGNRSIFSRVLAREVRATLKKGGQVILFLNRRGASTFVQCRDCGFVMRCRRCEVSLVYHRDEEKLLCHQCSYSISVPKSCPECHSKRIRFSGLGTERVEQEASVAFKDARLLRWDRDVTRTRYSHERILEKFVSHQADILIGTQMIAKGLDIPGVTLVGVVHADVGLFLPDFRAAERAFQILTQVAGRSGRGVEAGKVIMQTYSPLHYAVQTAARQDYKAFYDREITYRKQLNYPPYSRLACLSYTHTNDVACKKEVERVANLIKTEIEKGMPDIEVFGPTPAFVARKRGRYRWQLIIKGHDFHTLLAGLTLPSGWSLDVDPLGMV